MDARIDRPADTTAAWLRLHLVDLIILVLGTFLTLRFWFVMFGIDNRAFMATIAILSLCEIVKRVVIARRQWERPQLFCTERRFDLVASLALGTTPWPITITLPLNAASPLWSLAPAFALAGWVRPIAGVLVVGVAAYRLVANRG